LVAKNEGDPAISFQQDTLFMLDAMRKLLREKCTNLTILGCEEPGSNREAGGGAIVSDLEASILRRHSAVEQVLRRR
jgi:hypothetical protein